MGAGEVLSRLRRHYIQPGQNLPGGVFLPEVQAPGSQRRIDALYVGFTRSRGNYLDGHEIKVSRSDWLHELESPDKADWWHCHTHRWWIVVPDLTVVKAEELPAGWGLMVVNPRTKTRLDIAAKAEVREPEVDFPLLLELLKKQDTLRAKAVSDERYDRSRLINEGVAKALALRLVEENDRANRHGERARQTLTRLQEFTGLDFDGAEGSPGLVWGRLEDSASVLKAFCQNEVKIKTHLRRSRSTLARIVEDTSALLSSIEEDWQTNESGGDWK